MYCVDETRFIERIRKYTVFQLNIVHKVPCWLTARNDPHWSLYKLRVLVPASGVSLLVRRTRKKLVLNWIIDTHRHHSSDLELIKLYNQSLLLHPKTPGNDKSTVHQHAPNLSISLMWPCWQLKSPRKCTKTHDLKPVNMDRQRL